MTGAKCYTTKKYFSLKLCKKRKKNNKTKAEKLNKEKHEAKWKQSKKVSKKLVKATMKRKDFTIFQTYRVDFKIKTKIKNIQ